MNDWRYKCVDCETHNLTRYMDFRFIEPTQKIHEN